MLRASVSANATAGPSRLARVLVPARSPRAVTPNRYAVRYSSTTSPSPSPKLNPVPYPLKPEEAAHKMLLNGLVGSARPGNLFYSALLKFLGPWIVPYAKEFGLGESLEMRDMKAVYWPVWRIDAILEGKVKAEEGAGKEGDACLVLEEGYVPGMSTRLPGHHRSCSRRQARRRSAEREYDGLGRAQGSARAPRWSAKVSKPTST